MNESFSRSALLWGDIGNEKLANAHVAVFGVGGVGGYAVEALARAGVGALTLIDRDTVAQSNLNRQIIATMNTIGKEKVDVAKERVLSINPDCKVTALPMFYLAENADELPLSQFTYIIDAIDTMSAKMELITRAKKANVPIICAMGCGNKLDPTKFCISDLYETTMDPVARVLRRELRKKGVNELKVVYSTEKALKPLNSHEQASEEKHIKQTPGSVSFVPGAAGLVLASAVIRDIVGI